ncbi:MAG: hypothetical protein WC895_00580 [Candidatus Shapirobacteria bacterium]|jgi:hypothetical protein
MAESAPQQFTEREIGKIVDSVQDTTRQESNPKPKEKKFGDAFKRRFAAGIAAFTIATGAGAVTGCEVNPQPIIETEATVESSETEPSVTVTPTETTVKVTPTPTEAPTPTPTEVPLTPEQQEKKDLQEKMELAPDIEGAEKVIKEINGLKRVTYERDGVYIGEYKKEVTQTDENGEVTEVGGIALIGSEAEKILNEQLPTAKNGYLMPLAADISDLTTLENVNLAINSEGTLVDGPYFIQISFGSETIDVTNVLPRETNMYQSSSMSTGQEINRTELCQNSSEYIDGKEMEFVVINSNFIDRKIRIINVVMGDKLGETNEPILEGCIPGMVQTIEVIKKQSFDNILKFNEVPVFVVSNN